ncbi:MAG: flagellar hook-basal body complex protein [Terracidiphilus sp.]|jgi:flagellar hook protein FlgE
MASFYIPLSGLNADSTALNTIANDLSNMNTTAFKAQATNFSDLFYQQVGTSGSGDAIQVGGGTKVAANETDFTQGSIDSTGVDTDAAMNGNGFFVLNDGGVNVFTRAGDFSLASNGNLITTDGLSVMGYPTVKGVVNTNAALAAVNIPENQVEPPSATTTFGMTATLDSATLVGGSVPGQVQVYDSLGNSYEATVTYTKTGTNAWSYGISLPDSLQASPPTPAVVTTAVTPTSKVVGLNTLYTYDFGSSEGALATVDKASTLTIGGVAVAIPAAGELVSALNGQINGLGVAGVSSTLSNGVLTVTAPTATAVVSAVSQDMAGATINYSFGSSGAATATVDPTTNLTITGLTAGGNTATITAPPIAAGELVGAYQLALQGAVTAAGITGVTVSNVGGTLTVTGANMTTTGSVIQDPVASANATGTLTFDSNGNLVSPAANVSGISFAGLADGASTLNMTWDVLGPSGAPTISQVDATSSVSATTQNGYASGNYQSFTVGSDGTVTATYSNGQTQIVGQLALANMANLQGLHDLGNTEYATTLASGTASIGISGTNGLGTLTGGAVEESNVNISTEFSDLIIAQRAFEANAKAVTTFDTLTQETINMIH